MIARILVFAVLLIYPAHVYCDDLAWPIFDGENKQETSKQIDPIALNSMLESFLNGKQPLGERRHTADEFVALIITGQVPANFRLNASHVESLIEKTNNPTDPRTMSLGIFNIWSACCRFEPKLQMHEWALWKRCHERDFVGREFFLDSLAWLDWTNRETKAQRFDAFTELLESEACDASDFSTMAASIGRVPMYHPESFEECLDFLVKLGYASHFDKKTCKYIVDSIKGYRELEGWQQELQAEEEKPSLPLIPSKP